MNRDGNAYTFLFAIGLVLVVAVLLTAVTEGLGPTQQKNINNKKKSEILASIGIESSLADAGKKFEANIVGRVLIDVNGNVISEASGEIPDALSEEAKSDPFYFDVQKQYKSIQALRGDARATLERKAQYPLFIGAQTYDTTLTVNYVTLDTNELDVVVETKHTVNVDTTLTDTVYIVPLIGTGLWGPIWGNIALKADGKTIYGTSFGHKTETPGLGAEIEQDAFEKSFKGKMFQYGSNEDFASVKVVKAGTELKNQDYVNGITGGTITSNGVDKMIENIMSVYSNYFKNN